MPTDVSDARVDTAPVARSATALDPVLVVDDAAKFFPVLGARSGDPKEFCVFRDVSMSVGRGEFLSIIGHSGCGKSTLLNAMAGFDRLTSGSVRIDGEEVTGPGLDRMVVFQSFALLPWLTTYDNVRYAVQAANRDWPADRIREHTMRYLEMMSLGDAASKRPAHLSGGMRQRVGLARAFAVDPKLLLLDEPFAQIDALTRGVIQDELVRMWNDSGATICMVTHDVEEAILLSDRIALMSNGPDARVAEIVSIDIPRPRRRETLIESPEYMAIRVRILKFLIEHQAQPSTDGDPVAFDSTNDRIRAVTDE